MDRDEMVVKAMSWALRSLARQDPKAVKAFVAKHGEELAPRVKREVSTKLTTGRKTVKKDLSPRPKDLGPKDLRTKDPKDLRH
jgi:3-methyladenine DNA glycosylase AlkD